MPVTVNGGYQTRDFIYIDDVLKIMKISMQIAQSKRDSIIFNVGTGRSVNINRLFQMIKKVVPNNRKLLEKS